MTDPITETALAQGYRNNDNTVWCKNPECHRPWHGLPQEVSGSTRNAPRYCPGSHEFEES